VPRAAQYVVAAVVAAFAVWMIAHPLAIAEVLGRPHETASQRINLRASWGGAVLGVALFVAWSPGLSSGGRVLAAGLLGALMAGIAVARVVGFVLDGQPDALQWVWLAAEIVLLIAAAIALRAMGAPSAQSASAP
jgi:uncharacterized protein (DUF486 family)